MATNFIRSTTLEHIRYERGLRNKHMRELAMFPLGTALLPGMVLPLRLFEDRYLQMYATIIDADREFGVVLIERGREALDDNETFAVGCTAHVVGSGMNDDGTIGLVAVGRTRIAIDEWLAPDPYPRALVTDLEDEPLTEPGLESVREAIDRTRVLLAMAAELSPGLETDLPELAYSPGLAMYQVAQLAGLQSLDMQEVLEAPSSDSRAALIMHKVDDTIELIRLQLEVGHS